MSTLSLIEAMEAAGCDAETILRAVKADAQKKSVSNRERVRKHREQRSRNITAVSEQNEKEAPQTPKENTPPSPPKGGHIPPTELKISFSEAWGAWPEGQGRGCGEPEAFRAFASQVRDGADPPSIAAAAKRYVASLDGPCLRFDRFCRNEVWREWAPKSEAVNWHAALSLFKQTGRWREDRGPKPGEPGCKAPPEILREFDFRTEGEAA